MPPLKDTKAEEYALHIQEIVSQLKKTSKKAIAENEAHIVPPEVAKEKYGGRVGETFYLFPNEAPSKEIIDAYERVKPYYGTGEDAVSFEMHLSHRQMTVMFVDGDLVIRKDRNLFIERLTETNLRDALEATKGSKQIDLANAKIFVFPYKSIDFFISDSFEPQLSGRSDHRNPKNWITFPITDDFDYTEIRKKCREYASSHPLDGNNPNVIEINMDDVLNKVAEKMAQREAPKVVTENLSKEATNRTNNKGCMVVLAIIMIPLMLYWLMF